MKTFDHGRWHYELIETLGTYRELNHFVTDEAAFSAHIYGAGRPKKALEDGSLGDVDNSGVERFRSYLRQGIDTALSSYRRQLPVVAVSVTEAATIEAFEVMFYSDPDSIKALEKDFQDQNFKAVVTLHELKNATSLDELRQAMVDRAVAIATQGKSKAKVLSRLEKLTGDQFDANVRSRYLTLVDLRNEIVHENRKHDLTSSLVEKHLTTGIDFVRELGCFMARKGLPIHDPMQLFASP